jgi:hypothetical protein
MEVDNEILKQILREQAWERAKGELRAMLRTFYREPETFEPLSVKVDAFIADVEGNELG